MWDPGRGGVRAARSVAVGLVVSGVASASHLVGGGAHTSWLAVAAATVVVALVAAFLTGRRLGTTTLVVLLAVAQVGVHALSGYLHGQLPWHDPSMLLAHLAGVAVSALLLSRGERLLWRLHAWLRPRLLGALQGAPVVATVLAPAASVVRVPTSPLLGAVTRRGPPVPVV